MTEFDRAGIAERLRGLFGGADDGNLTGIAERLGVEEVSLRISIDDVSPHPTVEVLAAVIREYGVDPTWLLTGRYNSTTHRSSIEVDASIPGALRDFMIQGAPRIAEPPSENIHPREANGSRDIDPQGPYTA